MDSRTLASLIGLFSGVVTSSVGAWAGYRKIRSELIGSYRQNLFLKQQESCEAIWEALEVASFLVTEDSIICGTPNDWKLNIEKTIEFNRRLTRVFCSYYGLYLSKQTRSTLFQLRDFLVNIVSDIEDNDSDYIVLSNTQVRRIRGRVTALRIALRSEIGVKDLKIGQEEADKAELYS